MIKNHRINIYIAEDQNEKLDKWSKRMAISKTNLINLSIRAGLDAIIRAVEPAESLSEEQWAKILKSMENSGVDVAKEAKAHNPAS